MKLYFNASWPQNNLHKNVFGDNVCVLNLFLPSLTNVFINLF